jgi:hypothetical protein
MGMRDDYRRWCQETQVDSQAAGRTWAAEVLASAGITIRAAG